MGNYEVAEIQEKKSLIGGKISYHFMGKSYETRQLAETAREAEIQRMAEVKRRHEELAQEERERERVQAELQRDYNNAVARYDEDPEYATFYVATNPLRDLRSNFFGAVKDSNLASLVDLPELTKGISEVCRHIHIMGFEVISIIPAEAGVGAYKFTNGQSAAGAGWGYSFTQGVVITAKKVRRQG